MNHQSWPKLADVFPDFAARLRRGLITAERNDLAGKVDELEIRAKCDCDDEFCASFYTVSPHKLRMRGVQDHATLDAETIELEELLLVDVVDGEIEFVEVLFDDGFKNQLDTHFLKGRV